MAKELLTVLKLDDAQFRRGMSDNQKAVLGFSGAVVAAGAAIFGATVAVANYEDSMNDAAKAAGLAIEDFSALNHVANLSGVSMELLGKSMRKLIAPTAQTQQDLAAFGISLKDANGQMKSQTVLLEEISTKYKALKNPADKALLSMVAFGEKGAAMASLLENNIGDLTKQAKAMGLVITQEAAEAAGKLSDNMDVLQGSVFGLGKSVADSIIKFVNQTGVIEMLSGAIQKVTGFWNSLDEDTRQAIVSAGAAVVAIAAIAGAVTLVSIALSTLSINPVFLVIGAIAALAAGIVYLESKIGLVSAAAYALQATFDSIYNIVRPVVTEIQKLFEFDTSEAPDFEKIFTDLARYAVQGVAIAVSVIKNLNSIVFKLGEGIVEVGKLFLALSPANLAATIAGGGISVTETLQNLADVGRETAGVFNSDWLKPGEDAVKAFNIRLEELKKRNKEVQEEQKKTAEGAKTPTGGPANKEFVSTLQKLGDAASTTKVKFGEMMSQIGSGEWAKASASAEQFGMAISEIGDIAGKTLQPVVDVLGQISKVHQEEIKRDTDKSLYNLDFVTQVMQRQAAEELQRVTDLEDAKLEAVKKSQAAQLGILQQGMVERLRLLDQQFATEEQKREAAYQRQLEEERMKWMADTAAFLAATRSKEERRIIQEEQDQAWNEREAQLEAEHKTYMAEFAGQWGADKQAATDEENKKLQEAKIASDLAIEKAEQEKNAKLKALQDQKEENDKKAAKFRTFIEWMGASAAMETQKGAQVAQVMASTAAGAAQAFASTAWIPIVGPAIGAALAGTILAYGARSVQLIRTQRVPPPISLAFGSGGVTMGPSHAAGGIDTMIGGRAANVEGQEAVIDRKRTSQLFGFIDNLTSGRQVAQRGPTTVNLHFYGVRNATPAFAREVMDIAKREIDSEAMIA